MNQHTLLAARLRALADEVEMLEPAGFEPPPSISRELRLPDGRFYVQHAQKDLIVLHGTAGTTASGAVSHWRSQVDPVGTAFIVDFTGAIFEVFDPRCWAYHLGISGSHGPRHDQRSIGIEIVNVGPLRRRGDDLYWWWQDWSTRYCGISEQDRYLAQSWRGEAYWATYSPAQYAALKVLIAYLCTRFQIPAALPPPEMRAAAAPSGLFAQFQGIAAHQNFRSDKVDVGPAFHWHQL